MTALVSVLFITTIPINCKITTFSLYLFTINPVHFTLLATIDCIKSILLFANATVVALTYACVQSTHLVLTESPIHKRIFHGIAKRNG